MTDVLQGPHAPHGTHGPHGQHGSHAPRYWSQWLQPPVVLSVAAVVGTIYVTQVLQSERLEAMRMQVESIKSDYQRRDVYIEQLQSIDRRLSVIELKLGESTGARR